MRSSPRSASKSLLATTITAALISFSGGLTAGMLSPDLQVTGSVALSTAIGVAPFSDGDVTQTGTISNTAGGVLTTYGYSTSPGVADGVDDASTLLPAVNPLTANLTATGDGIGYSTSLAALFPAGFDFEEGYDFITEFGIDLQNDSLTDTFIITLMADFNHVVAASGADDFAQSRLDLELDNLDVLASEVLSDTFYGDELNRRMTGTFGDTISDTGSFQFDVILTPGQMARVTGTQQWEGGVYEPGSSNVNALFDLAISSVACEGACVAVAVPVPATAYLFAFALPGFALLQRRRRSRAAYCRL